MKSLIAAVALAATIGAVAAPANAFPFVNGQLTIAGPEVTQVGWRCGPFRHFDPRFGRCVANFHPRWHWRFWHRY